MGVQPPLPQPNKRKGLREIATPFCSRGFLLPRWYPSNRARSGLFLDLGAGASYTSISFQERGTHLLGVLVGGIGVRYKTFFIEDRLRHYSNGHTSYPNRSVNANITSVGMYF